MTTAELERRLTAVEKRLAAMPSPRSTNKDWILKMWGSFSNDADFEKAMKLGRKWRDAENRKSLRSASSRRRKSSK